MSVMKEYCVQHGVPCFTMYLGEDKKCTAKWKHITPHNFHKEIREHENGFAIVTGFTHMVVDLDLKHNPPPALKEELDRECESIERTPGGYHYWYKYDESVKHLRNKTELYWDGVKIDGLDVRSKGGICYASPTSYVTSTGERKSYEWIKGDLSSAAAMPPRILEHLSNDAPRSSKEKMEKKEEVQRALPETDEIVLVLGGLSVARANSYSQWITVGMALKNDGYACELWDDWSRQSAKYCEGECAKRWNGFAEREKPVTTATLYQWLKEDNYEVFTKLQSRKHKIKHDLLAATHATVADAFYEMNPNAYLFVQEGWFVLQSNNVWNGTGSTEILSIPNIINHIRKLKHN